MLFRTFALSAFLFLFVAGILSADTVTQEWTYNYNGTANGDDIPYAACLGPSGSIYLTGSSAVTTYGADAVTLKLNSSGAPLWTRNYHYYSGIQTDTGLAIAADTAENVYVLAYCEGYGYVTIKYDSLGNLLWAAKFYSANRDAINSKQAIAVDSSGNVYIAFSAKINSTYDLASIKYSSSGNQQWFANYHYSGDDFVQSMALDNSGNVYLTGKSIGEHGYDFATVKYNSSGIQQWAKRYTQADNNDVPSSIGVDSLDNVYVSGISQMSASEFDYVAVKYNSAGTQQWARISIESPSWDLTYLKSPAMIVNQDGTLYLGGVVKSGNVSYLFLAKTNAGGSFERTGLVSRPFLGLTSDTTMVKDVWGNIYLINTESFFSSTDTLLAKFTSDCRQLWTASIINNYYHFLNVDNSGNIYVSGNQISTYNNYLVIKYSQSFCAESLAGDLNGDCKVNFKDFSAMSLEWLECAAIPASSCP